MANMLSKNVVARGDTSNIAKSRFITTPDHLTTFNGGYIVPVLVKACEPNSQYVLDLASVINMPTLLNEFYGKAWVDCYAFYATEELLMDNFEDFIGEGKDNSFNTKLYGRAGRAPNTQSGGSIEPTLFKPRLVHHVDPESEEEEGLIEVKPHSLENYLGLPIGEFNLDVMYIDATPYRMYNMIYNCYFRSPFLMDPKLTDFGMSESEIDNYKLLKACKLPDYFTGYQTINPQLFDDIEIGLSGVVDVQADSRYADVGSGDVLIDQNPDVDLTFRIKNETPPSGLVSEISGSLIPGTSDRMGNFGDVSTGNKYSYYSGLKGTLLSGAKADIGGIHPYVDLAEATSTSLSAIRTAFVLQHISEKSLLGTDLKSLYSWAFGIKLNDFHLDRPLYVGGARVPLAVNGVSQTTPAVSDENGNALTTPLGHVAGQSKTVGKNLNHIYFNSPMHGWLMVLIVVRQENVYEYGIDRMLCRKDRFDYFWRDFIHAGNQKTFNYELYYDVDMSESQLYEAFGFAPYAEHIRRDFNRISGYFSSKAQGSLNTYHLGSVLDGLPHLEEDFILSDAEEVFDRLIAVESDKAHQFEGYFYFKMSKIIPVPTTSDPGLRVL